MNDTKIGDNDARVKVQIGLHRSPRRLQWDRGRWIWLLADSAGSRSGVGSWRQCRRSAALRSRRHCGRRLVAVAHRPHRASRRASPVAERVGPGADVVVVRARTTIRSNGASSCCRGALAISSGLWWLSPRVTWYVGASGVLHSVMAAGCAKHLGGARLGSLDSADRPVRAISPTSSSGGLRAAPGRRRCPSVRRRLRICGRGCTLLAYRYNSPPFPRLRTARCYMSLAFVFPGQGSQSVGMMSALAKLSPVIEATFAQASEVLGYDLWKRCQEGPAEALNATECTQPAMLTAGVATYRLWRERGGAVPQAHGRAQPGRVQRAGGGRLPRFQDRGRSGEVSRRSHAGRGAARARAPWPPFWVWRTPTSRRPARGGAGRSGRGGQFQCAGAGGDRRQRRPRSRVPSRPPPPRARGARMALAVSVPAHSSLMAPAAEQLRERLDGVRGGGRRRELRCTAST